MQLTYLNPTHTLIVAHLDAGETLGTLEGGEHGATHYIKVDGTDPNYVALAEKDPTFESVVDPGAVTMPPAATEPPPPQNGGKAAEPAEEAPHETHGRSHRAK